MPLWTTRLMIILALNSTVLWLVSTIVYIRSSNKEDQKANLTKSSFTNENTTNNKPSKRKPGIIIFPNTNKFIPDPQVNEKCSPNETFCIKVDNYPKEYLSNLLRTSEYKSTSYFGIDTIQTRIYNSNLEAFCESKEEVIFPQAGITKDDEWRYIIQDLNIDKTNFRQGIRMEKCIGGTDAKCKFDDLLPFGHSTNCVQKFIYKKLVAIKNSKELYYENFKIPSHCECMYTMYSKF